MKKILFQHGEIVTIQGLIDADFLIEGSVISKVSKGIEDSEAEVIDCTGKWIFPGVLEKTALSADLLFDELLI